MSFSGFSRFLWALVVVVSVVGCAAYQRSDNAAAAKTRMVGLSREDVLACMGPPKKKAAEGATEVWSYVSTDGAVNSSSDTFKPVSTYSHTTGSKDRSFCLVNVVMKEGAVKAVRYNGPTGSFLVPDEQCGYAVANCVGGGLE